MKILFIFGTRPEAIKMVPLIKEFRKFKNSFKIGICVSAQHRSLLDQVLNFFKLKPDYDLNIMKDSQTLFDITIAAFKGIEKVIDTFKPEILFVQGDTTTVLAGALSGYYKKVKVAHLEAGLRSQNKYSPFPEELNRKLTSHVADYHFAPTRKAKENLLKEGITKNIWVVGNTVIDALLLGLEKIKKEGQKKYYKFFDFLDFSKKIILVTGHRRESFGKPFENICQAIEKLAKNNENIEIVYPAHFNPNVRKPVERILKGKSRIHIIEPLDYPRFIWLMSKSFLVLTDSGGIQEEGPSLGKPVLVMREITERQEGINAGTARLVGTDIKNIVKETERLIKNESEYKTMSRKNNPYGDGKSSQRIVKLMLEISKKRK